MATHKRLIIDWLYLGLAFEDIGSEFGPSTIESYFDLETGQVISMTDEIRSALDQIESELDDALPQDAEITVEAIRTTDAFQRLLDWQQEAVLSAAEVQFGDFNRFKAVPRFGSREEYGFMEDFAETVSDAAVRARLEDALGQRGAFRRFRNVLAADRRLERQWRRYENQRKREAMLEWLSDVGVEPANPEDGAWEPPPLPELRKIMFAEVRKFVRQASALPGIERIALIGSLTTEKEFPKDVDLLVTVTGDCDLAPLATLARQLSGHMQSQKAGADVFLANPEGKYLGRTCPWRECGPGIRRRCDALHCGQRHYLHDDLMTIRLNKNLIARPPVVLWPHPATAADVPPDVRDELIEPLEREPS